MRSSGCNVKLLPLSSLFIGSMGTPHLAVTPVPMGWVGGGQQSWCSDLLPVVAELLRTEDIEVPAAPEPSAPCEEPPSPVVLTAPLLQWDEKKSECVVCMEQEVRPRHAWCWSRGGVRAAAP